MAVRFFMLQAHYRSTLDFSNDALEAADRGYKRLFSAIRLLDKIEPSKQSDVNNLNELIANSYAAMDDDFNSPVLIAELFESVRMINSLYDAKLKIDQKDLGMLKSYIQHFVFDVLGLQDEENLVDTEGFDQLMKVVIKLRNEAKQKKDFVTSDKIREELLSIGIQLKDRKEETLWNK